MVLGSRWPWHPCVLTALVLWRLGEQRPWQSKCLRIPAVFAPDIPEEADSSIFVVSAFLQHQHTSIQAVSRHQHPGNLGVWSILVCGRPVLQCTSSLSIVAFWRSLHIGIPATLAYWYPGDLGTPESQWPWHEALSVVAGTLKHGYLKLAPLSRVSKDQSALVY